MALLDESIESPCPGCGGTLFEMVSVPDVATGDHLVDIRTCLKCGYEQHESWWNGGE